MRTKKNLRLIALTATLAQLFYAHPVLAATGDISNVENFITSVIKIMAGLAGLVATGFFVMGGFHYITSSGNPENLEKAKRTLLWSGIGLAIVFGAFVLVNIITTQATKSFGS